jgi:hypothetical protein
VDHRVLAVAWYRFRGTFERRWPGYLTIIVLIGLLGGLAMASAATARRTQSAFSLHIDPGTYSPHTVHAIAHLPLVTSARTYVAIDALQASPNGLADLNTPFNEQVEFVGSLNGLYFTQDRIRIVEGRLSNLQRADEVVVSELTAHHFNLHVGQLMPLNFYTAAQANDPNFDPAVKQPASRLTVRITGIGVFTDEVVQDDIDRVDRVLLTPALTQLKLTCCSTYTWIGLRLLHGNADVPAVQAEYARAAGVSHQYFRITSVVEAQGERAVRPESIAAAVFALIVALAALVLGTQAVYRQIYSHRSDRAILRSLGADRLVDALDSLFGICGALVFGSLLAVVVAIALSPLAPLGPIHRLEVSPGISFDWTVLGIGTATLLIVVGGSAALLAFRDSPERIHRRNARTTRGSGVAAAAAGSGLPVAAVTGVRFALEAGSERDSVPVRSTIFGTVLALIVLVGALTFGASLNSLISHPGLYGWNWDSALVAGSGYGTISTADSTRLLDQDHSIAAWSGVYFDSLAIDGHSVPVIAQRVRAQPAPPILTGHAVDGEGQVVLGGTTLAMLHKQVGDFVEVANGRPIHRLQIVGTATIPTIGIGHGVHPSMGYGALVPIDALPAAYFAATPNPSGASVHGPKAILIRLRPGANTVAAQRVLGRIAFHLSQARESLGVALTLVQRPAEIVNYRSMGSAPMILGAGLVAGAALAQALTLATSVRRRARELALLKALGFTRRQFALVVAWQSTISVGLGALAGVPLGIIAGRFLWTRFATQLNAVPQPQVPTLTIVLVVIGALVLANVVAALPGRTAARSPTALILRAE